MSAEKIVIPHRPYTVEDFFALVPDGQKADLIDGEIYMASPDTPRNDDLGGFIAFLLRPYVRRKNLGRVTGSRVAYVLTSIQSPEPEVAFISRARDSDVKKTRVLGPPDVAVEIVPEDSKERDYLQKRKLYEDAGVQEYWIIDPIAGRCEFLRLQDAAFQPVPLEGETIFRSIAIPGFWLDVTWLLSDPLPGELDCLHQILTGPPQST